MTRWLLTILCLVSVVSHSFASDNPAIFIGQDIKTIFNYIDETKHIPDGFMSYTSLTELKGLSVAADYGAGENYADKLLKRYPGRSIQMGLYLVNQIELVADGRLDREIRRLASWINRAQVDVYLRIGYEFDWPKNKYDPELYKEAFRRIVNVMRQEHVANVHFVFHSATNMNREADAMLWYPGDEYVDWFGATFFNSLQYEVISEFARQAYQRKKPVMISECSPVGLKTTESKLQWFKQLFTIVQDNNVKIICYINSNWDAQPMFARNGWMDARIEADAQVLTYWMGKVN